MVDYTNGFLTQTYGLIRTLWAISIFLIVIIAINQIRPKLVREWDPKLTFYKPYRVAQRNSIAEILTLMTKNNKYELARFVSSEILLSASLAYAKPRSYFLKIKENPQELLKYFKNREVVALLYDSKIWVDRYMQQHDGSISFRKNLSLDREFVETLDNLLTIYKISISTIESIPR